MDTSSPTALAMYGGVHRPGSTAPRRTSAGEKAAVVAQKKLDNTEDTRKAQLINKSHVVETPLALPGIYKSFDSWKQEQKQKQKQLQRPSANAASTPGQPQQQTKSATIHDSKKNSRHLRAYLDSVSAMVADAEKKARASTVFDTERSSSHVNSEYGSRSVSQPLEVPRHVRCATSQFANPNMVRPMPPPSTGKPERPNTPSPAVVLPSRDPRGRHNSPSYRRGVPGPDFFRPEILPAPDSKPIDWFIAVKPHDAVGCYDGGHGHKTVENDGQFGSSNGSNIHNISSEKPVFGKSGCTMQTDYDQEDDGEVFTLLDEAHAANTSTDENAVPSSSQEATTTGTSSPTWAYDPTPWATSKCQRVPSGLPSATPSARMRAPLRTDAAASVWDIDSSGPLALKPLLPRDNPKVVRRSAEPRSPGMDDIRSLDNTTTQIPTIDKGSVRTGSDCHQRASATMPWHHASHIPSTFNNGPDIAPAAPSHSHRTEEKPNTQASANDRSNGIINPKALWPTPPLACGKDGEKEFPGTGLGISAPLGNSAPEHRRSCPMSLEDTDRLLRSLSTNDLIALCTKCQCELQERGRSFTSILRGSSGNNGKVAAAAAATTTEAAATVVPDDGIDIGGGRASKDKRKLGATDSDTEEHTVTADAKTSKQTQQGEEQKNKKHKSEDDSVFPSVEEGIMQSVHYSPAPSVTVNPPASHLDLQSKTEGQSDETAGAGEGSVDDKLLKQHLENTTLQTESRSTPATATEIAAAEPLPTNQTAGVDKAEDQGWHYVKEDCWKSPQPLCGDVFEMVERRECS